jgi:hypothetical protein
MKIIGANVTGSFILNSQDVTTTIQTSNVWSGSVATDITALNAATASLLNYTASNNAAISDILLETASINTFTSSIDNRTSVIEGKYITTGSNTFVGTQYVSNTTQATTFTSTASLYTDGGLRIGKDAYVSGSAFIKGNLTVFGTSSIEYVTSSVFVGLEYIDLNTDLPALRYAGIRVYDSGSNVGVTGSLFWDSQTNHWVYSNPSGSSYSGGMLISGPRASSLGSEQGTTNNALMKGQGGDHITSSAVLDDGTSLRIPYLTIVTGTMGATTFSGSGANLTSIPNAALTNSTISGIALGSNLATLTIGTGLSGTSYNGSGAVTIANTGVTSNVAGTGITVSGATGAVTITNSGVTSIVAGTGISINQGTGAVTVTNSITNNNQLTNGAGYITSAGTAAAANSVPWTGVSAGIRENYDLQFRPADNSSSYSGFSFASPGNSQNAGYLLVRGGADSDVYTQNGLTIVADLGWLTLAQRTTAGKGVRIMTGSPGSSTRFEVTTAGATNVYGALVATGDITAFSDRRVKENITTIDSALDKVTKLRGVYYTRTDIEDKSQKIGVIAQEIQEVLPQVVSESDKGILVVSYGNITGVLIEAIKEQQTQIEELKTIINGLTK